MKQISEELFAEVVSILRIVELADVVGGDSWCGESTARIDIDMLARARDARLALVEMVKPPVRPPALYKAVQRGWGDYTCAQQFDPEIMALADVVISEAGDVIIPAKHFGLFPWGSASIEGPERASVSVGGRPLADHEWTLNLWVRGTDGEIHASLKQYRWCVPSFLEKLLVEYEARGREDAQQAIRRAIGL